MKTILKTFSLAIALTALSYQGQAQFSMGLQGGVSTGTTRIDQIGAGFTDVINGDNIMGFEAGLYAKVKLGPLYVRPAALYNYRYGDVNYVDMNGTSHTSSFSMHKIEVPLTVGLKLIGPLGIEAAPVYNYIMSVTHQYNDYTVDLGKNGMGYRAGVIADFGPLFVNVSYQGVTYYNGGSTARFKEPYKIIFGLGVRLAGGSGGNND